MTTFSHTYMRFMEYPRAIIAVLVVVAIFLASFIPGIQLDASGDSLVLEGDESLEIYRQMNREYDSTDFLIVTYQPEADLFSAETRASIARLKAELEALDNVRSVVTYLDVPLLYSPRVSIANFSEGVHYLKDGRVDVELARQEFLHSPIYSDLLTSRSQKTTALQINLPPDDELRTLRNQRDDLRGIEKKSPAQHLELASLQERYEQARAERTRMEKRLVADVRATLDPYRAHARIFLGGIPMILSDMLDYVRNDMAVFGSMIGVFIVLTLCLFFRSPRWVILPLLTCGLTCIYMLGGIAFAGLKLTVISANFIALLLIIALSITIHLAVSFIETEKDHPSLDQYQLVMASMRKMIKPCCYTTLTTMVAFLSLVMSGIRPLIDFGWMMTVAVGLALVVGFILMPAGLLLLPRQYHEAEDRVTSRFMHGFAVFADRQGRLLTGICLVVLVFSVAGIFQLKVENRFIDYFDTETEIHQGMLQIDAELGGTLPLDILVNRRQATPVVVDAAPVEAVPAASDVADEFFRDDGDEEFFADAEEDEFAGEASAEPAVYWFTRAGMQDIEKIHQFLDGMESTGKVLSLATLYHVLNDVVEGTVDDIQLALIRRSLSAEVNSQLVRPYLSADGQQARITVRVKETDRSLNRNAMLQEIHRFMQEEMGYTPDEYQVTGMMVLYNNMLQSLFSSQIVTLGLVFLAIMAMFAVLFRSLLVSLIAIAPNILAALFVLGGMGWAGIPLDMMTITIAAITVGIGVDDTIHYIHRFKKEFALDHDYMATMYRSHASIGRAMFYTSVVIIAGFSILGLSNFTPSIHFGLLTSVAMTAALLGALALLPRLLIIFKPFGAQAGV